MGDTRKTQYDENGNVVTGGYGAEVTDTDLAAGKARARMSTTAGADLPGVAARAKAAGPPKEETDPDKMSPLVRASYLARKKKQLTASDAGDALANR